MVKIDQFRADHRQTVIPIEAFIKFSSINGFLPTIIDIIKNFEEGRNDLYAVCSTIENTEARQFWILNAVDEENFLYMKRDKFLEGIIVSLKSHVHNLSMKDFEEIIDMICSKNPNDMVHVIAFNQLTRNGLAQGFISQRSTVSSYNSNPESIRNPVIDFDYTLKIVLIGPSSAGKTCMSLRLRDNSFDEKFNTTIGISHQILNFRVHGHNVKVFLYDTAGQERFKSMVRSYYRDCAGVILLYDVTSESSTEDLNYYIQEIRTYIDADSVVCIMANKFDLLRGKDVDNAISNLEKTVKDTGYIGRVVSAKTGINCHEVFLEFLKLLDLKYERVPIEKSHGIKLGNSKKGRIYSCCISQN
eukprot:gene21289-27584_t